jgi:glyoxylase-like metal-dependent hydrolase (beta-lactamase superfamily II)
VRVVGLHADVLVLTSRVWQTTCTVVRSGEEAFVIDSPVYPDELEALPVLLEQAGFPFSGLLATHGDWDHLLGRLAFPGASLGVGETTAARLRAEPAAAHRALRDFDERHYVERRSPLALGHVEPLPVPGYCGLGSGELELRPADGHTVDGMAMWVPWASVLICGDYLSPVEIPIVEGSIDGYLATLGRLEPLVEAAAWVVPGHGEVLDGQRAAAILREDRAYVEGLGEDPSGVALPLVRRGGEQRRLHAANVARIAAAEPRR